MTQKVAVIMPVYNGAKYVRQAIESVLRQTFTDWQLIIVNDASTDDTEKILESFKDNRIKIVKNEKNLGSVASRNIALKECRSEYIAILDADDISEPTRFEKQVNFLNSHPDFGLVGSWTKIIGENGKPTGQIGKDTTPPEKAPIKILFHNFLAHSSIMMRRKAIPEEPYRENAIPVEDVDLYLRMIHDFKFATLPKVLISYRSHPKGISKIYAEKKEVVMNRLITSELNKLGINPNPEELKIHRTNFGYPGANIENFLDKREKWLRKLMEQNMIAKIYPEILFNQVVAEKWLESCDANTKLGLKTWRIFHHSPISKNLYFKENWPKLIKFIVKCLIARGKY